MQMAKCDLEVYIHIPFCVRKCAYCDFLSFAAGQEVRSGYLEALKKEIAAYPHYHDYVVRTVFIGGGTPSILEGTEIAELLEELRRHAELSEDTEITIECNPGTVSEEKLELYRKAGINRLSFGLQSARNEELNILGRIHTWEQFLESYQMARNVGFRNINVDLMSGLPGQKTENWEETLSKVLLLRPEHISAYGLIIEEGTPFYQKYGEDERRREEGKSPVFLPTEDEERRMYYRTREILAASGYEQYEISNYSRPGRICLHNMGYWTGVDYVGFGLGASSLLRHRRYKNPENLEQYLKGDFSDREVDELSVADEMAEFMFLGLRTIRGVSRTTFYERFGKTMDSVYGDVIAKYGQAGLLMTSGDRVALTEDGIDVSNVIMADFL